jgi:hypothetical protein
MTKEQKYKKAIQTLQEIAMWGSDICNGWWAADKANKCLAGIKFRKKK